MSPEEKKLEKLNKLFEMVNEDFATPDDLIQLSEGLLSIISAEKERLGSDIEEAKGQSKKDIQNALTQINQKETLLVNLIQSLRNDTAQALSQATESLKKDIKRVEKKIPTKTNLSGLESDIKALNEQLNTLPTELTINNEAIRDGLELLQGDERLDKSAIKGLDDWEEIVALARNPKDHTIAGVRLLRYLADVNIEGITDGQTIVWDTTTGKFIAGSGGTGGGHTIEDEGTPLTQRTNLNFVGAGVTVTDDAGNDATVVTISTGGGSGDVTKVGTPVNNQIGVWTGDGTIEGDTNLTYDTTTDTLTTVNVAATNVTAGASTFTAININGAGGAGHVHLKHQASDPSSQASSSTIFADSNGNLTWLNDGLSKITLDGDGVTAARSYTLPDASGTIALTSDLHSAVTVTDSTSIDFTLTGQDITAQREALTGAITAPKNSNTTSLGSFTVAQLNTAISDADVATGGGTATGTNTGDQTSIVGITGTKAQFDTAVTDGNFLYVGDITQYTDELAQDAVGGMVDTTLVYTDLTPSLSRAALTGAITASAGSNTTALGSFTKSQLDTAVSDGNVLYVGDITQYTDELAQDAVGAMVGTSIVYNDAGATLQRAALTGAITASQDSNTTALGSFTKAQLDTAVSDGNVLYVGDVTTNATHTGEVTGSGALTVDKTAITNKTLVTAASADKILIADASDTDNLKYVTAQAIADLASGGTVTNFNDIYIDQSGGTSDTYGAITGTINGSNAVFTVSQAVYATGTLQVWLNGQLMIQGTGSDWVETTPASGTFTFNTAPATGSELTVAYQKVVTNSSTVVTTTTVTELAQDAVGTILTDSSEIDFTYNDGAPSITASIVASSIDESKLDASVNASLDLADTAVQPAGLTNYFNKTTDDSDDLTEGVTKLLLTSAERTKLSNTSGTNSGDQTTIVGITGTVAQFNTAITDGNIIPEAGGTFTGDILVPDEAYDATAWNGSLEVPTKNAIRDKIESMSSSVDYSLYAYSGGFY